MITSSVSFYVVQTAPETIGQILIELFGLFILVAPSIDNMASSTRWTLYAGVYVFLVSGILLLPLGPIVDMVLQVLGLSFRLSSLIVPASAGMIGAVSWWGIVERREDPWYLSGGIFGLATALLTILFWILLPAIVYGPGIVRTAGVVILFTGGLTVPVGIIAGLPLTYGRRQFGFSQSEGLDPIPE